MTDRELLELAAKSAGLSVWIGQWPQDDILFASTGRPDPTGIVTGVEWNPLADDGDALRLAVKLGMIVDVRYSAMSGMGGYNKVEFWLSGTETAQSIACHDFDGDSMAATRRAIVRAAAAIGEARA